MPKESEKRGDGSTSVVVSNSDENADEPKGAEKMVTLAQNEVLVTPLPFKQMTAMVIVLANESFCASMLQPFVGFLVAYLRDIPLDDAGYWSGILSGMFMFGQVVSASIWGRFSDKYGRRPPLVTGLFASGLMMLGFGFSSNIWMCATFRFFHGLFNGNILVAKTMMADITDKSNEATGFAFISLVSAIGFLLGPALGGILYNPAYSDTMQWAHFSKTGLFAKYPALLPSLVVFAYTMIGNVVCTFFIQESNPKAQPLPSLMTYIFPCLLVPAKPFVPMEPKVHKVEVTIEAEDSQTADPKGVAAVEEDHEDQRALDGLQNEPLAASGSSSPKRRTSSTARQRGRRAIPGSRTEDDLAEYPIPMSSRAHTQASSARSSANASMTSVETLFAQVQPVAGPNIIPEEDMLAISRTNSLRIATSDEDEEEEHEPHPHQEGSPSAQESPPSVLEEPEQRHYKHFGYREAFSLPCTRFMLSQYMVLVAADTALKECLPLWVISKRTSGGFDLSQEVVGYILLINAGPMLVSNLLFHKACNHFPDRMQLFRLGCFITGVAAFLLPLGSYVNSVVLGLLIVVVMTSIRQLFCSWLYSLNTMLTARSAPPGHVGSIMGINQSCGAAMRGLVPVLASPLFAWSISSSRFFFVNHTFVFFLSSLLFFFSSWRAYKIRTNEQGSLEMVS